MHGKDEVFTARSPSTALLVIDSADRNPTKTLTSEASAVGQEYENSNIASAPFPSTPYDFTIAKGQNVFTGFVKRIGITEIAFNWGLFNINDTCNKLNFTSAGYDGVNIAGTITIPNGFYPDPTTLATAINDALTTLLGSTDILTCSFDTLTQRFVFTTSSTSPIAFTILPPLSNNDPIEFTNSPYKSLYEIIGMVFSTTNTFDTNPKFAANPPLMRWTEYIDIVCTNLTNNQHIKDFSTLPQIYNPKPLLCRLYLDDETHLATSDYVVGTSPIRLYRQFKTPKMIEWSSTQPIGNLSFQVYDDSGRILQGWDARQPTFTLPDWQLTLLLSED
jgi:hypothetical protein